MNSSSVTIHDLGGGSFANRTGNRLEAFIQHQLEDHAYTEFLDHKRQLFANRDCIDGKRYGRQIYCGKSIYETNRRCDFLVLNKAKWREGLIIECKWQQSSGSVDEKYPFTLFNIIKIGVPTIVLLDGGGYKLEALKWLKSQVNQEGALIGCYTMAEFQAIVNKGFLG